MVLLGVTILLFNVVYVNNIISRFHMCHLPMITKFNAKIGCGVSLKWLHVSKVLPNQIFFI